jgi:hypothetical protein
VTMKPMRSFVQSCFLLLVSSCALAGCSRDQTEVQIAKKATNELRSRLDYGEYEDVYETADPRLQQSQTEQEFVGRLKIIHEKLGKVETSKLHSQTITQDERGLTSIVLVYDTEYDRGSGVEAFNWSIKGYQITLAQYDIDTKALATN